MPAESPLTMPPQDLRYKPYRPDWQWVPSAVLYARFILVAVTVGVTTYGVYQMLQAVRFASMTILQGTMIVFFALSLGLDRLLRRLGAGRRLQAARLRAAGPARPARAPRW